jgi:Bacterial regulatory protein, Fis family
MSAKHHLNLNEIAMLLGIHRNTLRYKLRQMGLQRRFSELSNDDLDRVLKLYKRIRPDSGLRYTTGFLRHHHLKVQRHRVRDSLERIDGLGRALRRHDTILRHKYHSRCSGTVLHIDGLHKLILWGFVILSMTSTFSAPPQVMTGNSPSSPVLQFRLLLDLSGV